MTIEYKKGGTLYITMTGDAVALSGLCGNNDGDADNDFELENDEVKKDRDILLRAVDPIYMSDRSRQFHRKCFILANHTLGNNSKNCLCLCGKAKRKPHLRK